jgi:hypothetical protein
MNGIYLSMFAVLTSIAACISDQSRTQVEGGTFVLHSAVAGASQASAACVPNPVDDTPPCCSYGSVVRPMQNTCTQARDLSPRIDASGLYRGENDANALPVASNVLQICAVHVIDNGEGDNWPHGPHGNLYVDFFRPDEPRQLSPDGADKRRIREPRLLRGPHRTHGETDEWLDDEALLFWKYGIFRYDASGPASERVVMRVWESDSRSEDGSWGRRNDVLGMELIDRASTTQGAKWVTFYKYTNDHPRARTNQVALRIRVKTGGTCPLD